MSDPSMNYNIDRDKLMQAVEKRKQEMRKAGFDDKEVLQAADDLIAKELKWIRFRYLLRWLWKAGAALAAAGAAWYGYSRMGG